MSENVNDQQPRTKGAANMNDENERSVASAGSHCEPVAWVAFAADASESRALFLTREAAERAARKHGWFVAELFAKPTLNDEEREAVEGLCELAQEHLGDDDPQVVAVRALLERTK